MNTDDGTWWIFAAFWLALAGWLAWIWLGPPVPELQHMINQYADPQEPK